MKSGSIKTRTSLKIVMLATSAWMLGASALSAQAPGEDLTVAPAVGPCGM